MLGAALWIVLTLATDRPVAHDDIVEQFNDGSIGSEPGVSLLRPVGGALPPYAVFAALPSICPEKLPGGYASLGFIYEPGHDLPIGIARRNRQGVDHVGLNCAALSHRNVAGYAGWAAQDRGGDACTPAGPAIVR